MRMCRGTVKRKNMIGLEPDHISVQPYKLVRQGHSTLSPIDYNINSASRLISGP